MLQPPCQSSFIVGITGASRAGKSLLSKNLARALATDLCQIVAQDDFRRTGKRAAEDSWVQKDATWLRNWETPNHTDWTAFEEAVRHAASSSNIVLVEGFCLLHSDAVRALLQSLIWIEIDEATLRHRRRSCPKEWDATSYFDECIWPAYLQYRAMVFGDSETLGCSGKSSSFTNCSQMLSGVETPTEICAQALSAVKHWKRYMQSPGKGPPQIKPQVQRSCWVEEPAAEHRATLVFIHGLPFCGQRGSDQLKLFSVCWNEFLWQHVRYVAPCSQDGRQWCAYSSEPGNDGRWQWDEEAAETATSDLAKLLEEEAAGLQRGGHLVLAGCSQGASLALRAVTRANGVAAHVVCLRGAPQPPEGRGGALDAQPDTADPRCCFYWLVGAQDQFWPRSVFCREVDDFLSSSAQPGSPAKSAVVLVEDIDHFSFSNAEDVLLSEIMHVVVQPALSPVATCNGNTEKDVGHEPELAVFREAVGRVLKKVPLEVAACFGISDVDAFTDHGLCWSGR